MNLKNRRMIGSLGKNTLWTIIGKAIAMVAYFGLDIIIARDLGAENGYAEWAFFVSIITMGFYISWFGINSSTKIYLAKQIDKKSRDNCISAGLFLRTILSLIVAIIIIFCYKKLAYLFGYPVKYPHLDRLILLGAAMVFLNDFTEFFKEICMGLSKFHILCFFITVEYGGYLIFGTLFVKMFHKSYGVAYGYIATGIIVMVFGMIFLRKIEYKKTKVNFEYKILCKEIFKYALPIMIIMIGGLVLVEMDTFMLGLLCKNPLEVANYSIAKQICSKATHVNYSIAVGTMTSFAIVDCGNFKSKLSKFKKINLLNFLVAIFIGGMMILFAKTVISFLYGTEFTGASIIVNYLTLYYFLYSISNLLSTFLDFQNKAKIRSICYSSVVLINFILNYLLIPILGGRGAAIATVISLIPYTILVIVLTIRQWLQLRSTI